ncbi:MAG TPA: hypothetical protein VMF69_03090 [Gemmataceae bacterium]|nr:hypothetical protein [Gemmataceae bacterium]
MFATITKTTLLVLALLLALLGPAARPARAQALPRPVINKLIKERTKQAYAADAQIQKTKKVLAKLPPGNPVTLNVQTILAQQQGVLASIQAQINLLTQLLAAEDRADLLNDLIQNTKKQINGAKNQQIKSALQAILSGLQTDLANTQALINILQSQIVLI